jgi:8-oxo-dGTP diphosphatase
MERSPVLVVAAAVVRDGRLLLALRPDGSHLAGHWELPGGKIEPGEQPVEALRRELLEELGVAASVGEPLCFNWHAYPDRQVLLLVYAATLDGAPQALGCKELRWCAFSEIEALPTPPADGPIFSRLRERLIP